MQNLSAGALALCLAISGCASVTGKVPVDVAGTAVVHEVRSVAGIYRFSGDGHFQAGPYKVHGIRHDVVRGNELSIGAYSQTSASGRFRFHLTGERAVWTAQCALQAASRSVTVDRLEFGSEETGLLCDMRSGALHARLHLHKGSAGEIGSVRIGDDRYRVQPYFQHDSNTHQLFATPAGLRIDQGGQPMGGLAFAHPGTLWFNPAVPADRQDALAAVISALLIHARRY